MEDTVMITMRNVAFALMPAAALSLMPVTPALAYGHGYGHGRAWGFAPFGVIAAIAGTAAAIATAPLALAAGAAPLAVAPGYGPAPSYYYPQPLAYGPPAYYGPAASYGPRGGFYGRPFGYHDAPRAYLPRHG